MAFARRLAAIIFIVAVPVLLITTNVRILTSEVRFYERGFREHDAEATTGIALEELDRAASEIVAYFEDDRETLRIVVEEDGDEVSLFDERETEHMEDVKGLMRLVYRLNEFTIAYVLAYVGLAALWAGERSLRQVARDALFGLAVGLGVVLVVGLLAVVGFDATWNQFHELAFRNDFWQLDPDTDHLIQMFPEPFWEQATYLVGVLVVVEGLGVAAVAGAYLLRTRERPTGA
ncbi:MAG: TIGR01906 family membrane protein [Dehalococcoidia bacterium]